MYMLQIFVILTVGVYTVLEDSTEEKKTGEDTDVTLSVEVEEAKTEDITNETGDDSEVTQSDENIEAKTKEKTEKSKEEDSEVLRKIEDNNMKSQLPHM